MKTKDRIWGKYSGENGGWGLGKHMDNLNVQWGFVVKECLREMELQYSALGDRNNTHLY